MSALRLTGMRGDVIDSMIQPGDIVLSGESLTPGLLATAGAGVLTGAAIASGLITRSNGGGAAFADTTDTSTNILLALAGNSPGAIIAPGSTFRLRYINKVAFLMTFTAGVGVIAGTGGSGVLNVAASLVRDYLVTILNATPAVTLQSNTTNANAVVTFVFPSGMTAWPLGSQGNPQGITVTPGMTVSGTGITAGTTVLGVTYGQGGITGVTLSANATATSVAGGTPLTFLPTVQFDGLASMTA